MAPKIIVFLAALCVVKASVINVNSLYDEGEQGIAEPQTTRCCDYHECQRYCRGIGYEDGTCTKERCRCINPHNSGEKMEANVDPQLVHNCHSQECERHCHRFGYSSGTCVNNRCQCDHIPSEENSSEGELNTLEPQSERNCHSKNCEWHCQRLGYSGGACVNNRCQCDHIPSEEYSSEGELNTLEPQSERNCHSQNCERYCQRIGYSGGACVNGRCQCNNIRGGEYSSEGELNTFEPQSDHNCHSQNCERHCHRLGYSGGACVNNHCQCNNIRSGEYSSEGELNTFEPQSDHNCHSQNCERHCHRLGYSGGACVNNHCQCNNIRSGEYSSEGELNTLEPQSERNCHSKNCEWHCQRLGYSGGACVNNRCQCDHIPSEEYSSEGELNTLEPESERNCHSKNCEWHCQRLGYSGGACVNNRCQCDHIPSEEYSSEGELNTLEPESERNCHSKNCEWHCQRLGYSGGACVNNRCQCDHIPSEEYSSEGELNTFEPQSDHNCHSQNCERHCHRLGYSGGACVNNHCQCNNIRSGEYSSEELNTLEPQSERNCHSKNCEWHCQRLGYSGGACVNNHCQCNNIQSGEYSSEGELNTLEPQSERNCHLQQCERHCQRLGYFSGTCVNNRCQCDNIQSGEYSSEGELNTFETQSERNCHSENCERHCHRLGYSGGFCINNRCQCNNIQSGEYSSEGELNTLEPQSEHNCHSQNCERHCQRIGYSGGACVNGRCQCEHIVSGEYSSEGELNTFEPQTVRCCELQECDHRCRRNGYTSGACVNGRCKCNNILSGEYNFEGELNTLEPQSERTCHSQNCERHCQRIGYSGGACVNNHCQCNNIRSGEYSSEGELNTFDPESERNCLSQNCERHCQRLGYSGGVCVNGRCQCDNILSEEFSSEGEPKTFESQSSRISCYFLVCERRCRRLGFTGGSCAHSRCTCDNGFRAEFTAEFIEESEAVIPEFEHRCYNTVCDQHCRRLGYSGGACSNGQCKCDAAETTVKHVEDSSSVIPAPSVEAADKEVVPSLEKEKEGVLNASHDCDAGQCTTVCHSIGYAGGLCRGGKCLCY